MSDSSSVSSKKSKDAGRPKRYICEYEGCDKAFTRPSIREQHYRSHTNDRPFKCDVEGCDKSFLRKSHLLAHKVSHEDTKPFHCSICGKGVNTSQHLRRHEITHTKSFKCDVEGCNEAFYRHPSLRHHKLTAHGNKITCPHCNKEFKRRDKLAQHELKFHGSSPAYQCDHPGCFKNFKTWSALQLHIKTNHPKLKCPVCGKGCVGKKGLDSHMLSHDETKMSKLWNCNYCDVGQFVKKADLIIHYNEFHDGNVPPDLLNPQDRLRLQQLTNDTKNVNRENLQELQQSKFQKIESDEDDDDESLVSDQLDSQRSIETFTSTIQSGKSSIISLISSNHRGKPMECPKKNCDKKFYKKYYYEKHLRWHEEQLAKIDLFLKSLEAGNDAGNDAGNTEIDPAILNIGAVPSPSEEKIGSMAPLSKKRKIENIASDHGNSSEDDTDNGYNDNDNDLDDLIELELKPLETSTN